MNAHDVLAPTDTFVHRHLGPSDQDVADMLRLLGLDALDTLAKQAVPDAIQLQGGLSIGPARGEHELLAELKATLQQNQVRRSLIGMGYYGCLTPPVILRNVLENPGWYTAYTPYQAEIAQGRMEALVNYQTMVSDLTGLPLANASLLDEGTAAAEAMSMCYAVARQKKRGFFVAEDCHPQTIEVIRTRAKPLGIQLVVGPLSSLDYAGQDVFGVLVQYPNTDGECHDHRALVEAAHAAGALVVVATDLLALTLLTPPGEWGADIAIGSAQRFGVPMGGGGPHAAFMATKDEHKRHMPGRIIGVSRDAKGKPGYRLSLQTREQHIRRDKATSNICTAQVLLAVMAGMYAVYHGPEGLLAIARRVRALTGTLAAGLRKLGFELSDAPRFDTLRVKLAAAAQAEILARAEAARLNLRVYPGGDLGVALDETCDVAVVDAVLAAFAGRDPGFTARALAKDVALAYPAPFARTTGFLTHEVFHRYHSETEMLRYLHRLEVKDLALNTSMIPLGSCTMKLNATSEMIPVTWPEVGAIHPFAPPEQVRGSRAMYRQLEGWLSDITGFPAVSLMPNAGSQGEYTGLLVLRAYQEDRGEGHRNVCLIPTSAHGTNPASAVMAGLEVVPVKCNDRGDIDVADLEAKAAQHASKLSCIMVTYPSTHGVFEASIKQICEIVHRHGGQVYLDGANMNAQVGLCRPGDFGADVCHLNLHKTFCIPHGGGGPGMGPIGVATHLAPFLPAHPFSDVRADKAIGPVSAAPYGSPSILPISWMYIGLMGSEGLKKATQVAILNANYMAKRLEGHYEVLYRGDHERVAHEFILDMRDFKRTAGIEVEDIAKRLMDYGFHAPTMSWPVPGTIMVEPTESESKAELDRFCDALIAIRGEIRAIEQGKLDREDNPLKNAPHTVEAVSGTEWPHAYSREQAAFPAPYLRAAKYWPPVARIDNAYGDRNLVCTCPPMADYAL
jgi:glycine dehydrogenase